MRHLALLLILGVILTAAAFGQDTGATAMPIGGMNYGTSTSVADQYGNVLIFDPIYSWGISPGVPTPAVGGTRSTGTSVVTTMVVMRYVLSAKTRVTVIPAGGGQPAIREYAASFQVLGLGKSSLYAVMNEYLPVSQENYMGYLQGPRKLIAIDAGASGTSLPTALTGFVNAALQSSGDVRLHAGTGAQLDLITSIEYASNPLIMVPASIAVRPRVARLIRYDGTKFTSTDVTLPQ